MEVEVERLVVAQFQGLPEELCEDEEEMKKREYAVVELKAQNVERPVVAQSRLTVLLLGGGVGSRASRCCCWS